MTNEWKYLPNGEKALANTNHNGGEYEKDKGRGYGELTQADQ